MHARPSHGASHGIPAGPFILLAALVCLVPDAALAHLRGGAPGGGFQSGFTHPIVGTDHLLAMLAVGIWGAQMGGRTVWTLPVTFPLIMTAGAILSMSGFELPLVELGKL